MQKCGAYFTSALYIEHWCEEKYGSLSLGEPDFSDDEEVNYSSTMLLGIMFYQFVYLAAIHDNYLTASYPCGTSVGGLF